MMENDQIVCTHCEKRIRYERPLFCPYCGGKLEPIDGLMDGTEEVGMYPRSAIAPFLIRLLGFTLVLLFPVAWIFGRSGVIWLAVLFSFAVLLFLMAAFVLPLSGEKKRK